MKNPGKYSKYEEALRPHIESIKRKIAKSKDGVVKIKVNTLTKRLGPAFQRKHAISIYQGVKYTLFKEGISVKTKTGKNGDKQLLMTKSTSRDKLPPSMRPNHELSIDLVSPEDIMPEKPKKLSKAYHARFFDTKGRPISFVESGKKRGKRVLELQIDEAFEIPEGTAKIVITRFPHRYTKEYVSDRPKLKFL